MKKIDAKIAPLIISILLIIISLVVDLVSVYILNWKHYIGIGGVIIATIFYFKHEKVYLVIFPLILIVGLFDLLDFFIFSFKVGISGFGVNLFFIALLIVFYFVNRDILNKSKPKEPELIKEDNSMVKSLMSRYADKTITELNDIAANNSGYTEEAKIAAKQIIEKKLGTTSDQN